MTIEVHETPWTEVLARVLTSQGLTLRVVDQSLLIDCPDGKS